MYECDPDLATGVYRELYPERSGNLLPETLSRASSIRDRQLKQSLTRSREIEAQGSKKIRNEHVIGRHERL